MTGAAIHSCSLVLAHAPDLVRHGSKPTRSPEEFAPMLTRLRSFEEAVYYGPNQVFIGNMRPEDLLAVPRPWWGPSALGNEGSARGPFGVIIDQNELYDRMAAADHFNLFQLGSATPGPKDLTIFRAGEPVGVMRAAHDLDESLFAPVLLENLAGKATGALALEQLLSITGLNSSEVEFVIGCGEEAVGDRYQRGGGNLGKAIAEQAGCLEASGQDVKAFCAGPMHALMVAGALVSAGIFRHVVVAAGGSLAKLGMKFSGSLKSGGPILEDVLAGLAILVGPEAEGTARLRLDAVGRHRVSSGSAQQALLRDLVTAPLDVLGMKMLDVDKYATELHDPEVTEPAGAGNVPSRNYKMLGAMASLRGELDRDELDWFEANKGMPGFSPTQGHVASAVPWIPHGLVRLASGEIETTLLMAKGSLFLGRMTELADGLSLLLEKI